MFPTRVNAVARWICVICLIQSVFHPVLGYPDEYNGENGLRRQHEQQQRDHYMSKVHRWKVLAREDEDGCMRRLICQIGIDPTIFGIYGILVAHFFSAKSVFLAEPEIKELEKSFKFGVTFRNIKFCKKCSPFCEYTTRDLIESTKTPSNSPDS